jgi:hypothetical protein
MDPFDYTDVKVRPPIDVLSIFFNLLTLLVLMMICGVGLLILVVFINPHIGINPFPPPTLPALALLPTSTPTPQLSLPPTWTPTAVLHPTSTRPPRPTSTRVPTEPASTEAGTDATQEPAENMPFVIQPGNPVAIGNIAHPDLGCDWMGIAGQATGLDNSPVIGLMIQLGGELNGKKMVPVTLTGTAAQYGEGGYEFTLSEKPVSSKQTLWVQLMDQEGTPLSEKIYFDTFSDCEKALVLLNFNQVGEIIANQ